MPVLDERRFSPAALASLAVDAAHLEAALAVVADHVRTLEERRAALRLQQVPAGAARMQRDLEVQAVSLHLHVLVRVGTDLSLGYL